MLGFRPRTSLLTCRKLLFLAWTDGGEVLFASSGINTTGITITTPECSCVGVTLTQLSSEDTPGAGDMASGEVNLTPTVPRGGGNMATDSAKRPTQFLQKKLEHIRGPRDIPNHQELN